jgi:hypothetical protein
MTNSVPKSTEFPKTDKLFDRDKHIATLSMGLVPNVQTRRQG